MPADGILFENELGYVTSTNSLCIGRFKSEGELVSPENALNTKAIEITDIWVGENEPIDPDKYKIWIRSIGNSSEGPDVGYIDIGQISGVLPIEKGGTGAVTKTDALINLGAFSVSGGTITGEINMSNHTITGLGTPIKNDSATNKEYVDKAINKPNLLYNSWFTVNQRGMKNYTVGAYGVDQWLLVEGSATVTENGITLNGRLRQKLEDKPIGTVFASVNMHSGTANAYYDAESGFFDIESDGGTVRAAKLEYGSVSTLKNDGPPDYEQELSKCQRYYLSLKPAGGGTIVGYGVAISATAIRISIPIPTTMRLMSSSKPTIEVEYTKMVNGKETACFLLRGNGVKQLDVQSLVVTNIGPSYITLQATPATNATQHQTYMLNNNTGANLAISAEL